MRTPFPAVLIETHAEPYHSVMARRCIVLEIYAETRTARVGVGSAAKGAGAWLEIVVPFSRLASTRERAIAMISEAAAAVVLQSVSHAPAEKSAVTEMAGAVA